MTALAKQPRPGLAAALSFVVFAGASAAAILSARDVFTDSLSWILLLVTAASAFATSASTTSSVISPAFICSVIAAVFLQPAETYAIMLTAETVVWLYERYRLPAFATNAAALPTAAITIAGLFQLLAPDTGSSSFYAAVGIAAPLTFGLNVALTAALGSVLNGTTLRSNLRAFFAFGPTIAFSTALVLATSAGYLQYGLRAIAFLVVALAIVGYMTHLVALSRQQARAHADLSWGIIASLLRTLNERDNRASRHSAAVAKFSRDIAAAAELPETDQDLAHTAGLMHDIGRFALSDRVLERGSELTNEDWRAIRRHPEIGANLLRDIGVYGPVGEIVHCHHERLDGRGYPRGLKEDEIPEVAKIVAIAEIYDTLTAPDTYRKPMSSFEALNELRRVSGRQVAGEYVELLSDLMYGKGVEYRHSEDASFDLELRIEERIKDSLQAT